MELPRDAEWLVIGSDGVFDVVPDDEVIAILARGATFALLSAIIDDALPLCLFFAKPEAY